MPNKKIRLAKFLAQAGIASRRKAEDLIRQGKVKVGKEIVKDVATNVIEDSDNVYVNNKKISPEEKVYYLLNKPAGYISSVSDPHNQKTVLDLVPKKPKVFPVGRLDKDSEGLLLLTNDGELAYQLTHPKFGVKKTYLVTVDKKIKKDLPAALKKGVKLQEGIAQADQARVVAPRKLEIIIHQGWKRQIRRMLEKLDYQVLKLFRTRENKLILGNLSKGKFKKIKIKDIL